MIGLVTGGLLNIALDRCSSLGWVWAPPVRALPRP